MLWYFVAMPDRNLHSHTTWHSGNQHFMPANVEKSEIISMGRIWVVTSHFHSIRSLMNLFTCDFPKSINANLNICTWHFLCNLYAQYWQIMIFSNVLQGKWIMTKEAVAQAKNLGTIVTNSNILSLKNCVLMPVSKSWPGQDNDLKMASKESRRWMNQFIFQIQLPHCPSDWLA